MTILLQFYRSRKWQQVQITIDHDRFRHRYVRRILQAMYAEGVRYCRVSTPATCSRCYHQTRWQPNPYWNKLAGTLGFTQGRPKRR